MKIDWKIDRFMGYTRITGTTTKGYGFLLIGGTMTTESAKKDIRKAFEAGRYWVTFK